MPLSTVSIRAYQVTCCLCGCEAPVDEDASKAIALAREKGFKAEWERVALKVLWLCSACQRPPAA